MYIEAVPNRSSPPAILLRESIREGQRVRKRTIANLSALPIEQVEMMKTAVGPFRARADAVQTAALLARFTVTVEPQTTDAEEKEHTFTLVTGYRWASAPVGLQIRPHNKARVANPRQQW